MAGVAEAAPGKLRDVGQAQAGFLGDLHGDEPEQDGAAGLKQLLLAALGEVPVVPQFLEDVLHFVLGERLFVGVLLLLVAHHGVIKGDELRRVADNPALVGAELKVGANAGERDRPCAAFPC